MQIKRLFLILTLVFGAMLAYTLYVDTGVEDDGAQTNISSFEECVAAGFPVMESYPEQCQADGQTFVRDIGNQIEMEDMIRVESPVPGALVESPLEITGEARGMWFFEADAPVYLYNDSGVEIAFGIATAQGDWMTEEFVPFTAVLEFELIEPMQSASGWLVLERDNPSDLPENDAELRIPVQFDLN